jgi:hypothetical protein
VTFDPTPIRERLALEVHTMPPAVRFGVALFSWLVELGPVHPRRPPSTRARVTIIDTTAREIPERAKRR